MRTAGSAGAIADSCSSGGGVVGGDAGGRKHVDSLLAVLLHRGGKGTNRHTDLLNPGARAALWWQS